MKEKLLKIKNSINHFIEISEKEKKSLKDSIEMLWLNADIQRKKTEIIIYTTKDLLKKNMKILNMISNQISFKISGCSTSQQKTIPD